MLPILFILFAWFRCVVAWGVVGHEIVATIAQMHLHPTVVDKLCDALPPYSSCHLAPVAAWADKIRRHQPWSAHMHYIGDKKDHPSQYCAFGDNGWEDERFNVLTAIRNTTLWIKEQRDGQEEALKFLIHFVGDLHMPLHLTGRDRGGNDMKVKFDGRITNLHSVWDTRLIAKSVRTVPSNYTLPLPSPQVENALRGTIYDPYIREIMWEGVLGSWKDEVQDWSSCLELPRTLDSIPTESFEATQTKLELTTLRELDCSYEWGQAIHKLNCDIIWPAYLDSVVLEMEANAKHYIELDSPEYTGRIKTDRVVEKLLAMAGIRLASILNGLYTDI